MAQGWDSYFDDLSSLSSDPNALATLGPEESHSKSIENLIGHHNFPGSVAPSEISTTNFNPNFFSNGNIGNPNSDCVYQRYENDAPWQIDGEQVDKDYLPRCESGDGEFSTDGLSTSSFPSSYVANLEGLKQDCGMLTSPFLDEYSDVSSCSDAGGGETRSSCKFTSSSLSKHETDASMKHNPSKWLSDQPEPIVFPREYPCTSNLRSPYNADVEKQVSEPTQANKSSDELENSRHLSEGEIVKTSGTDMLHVDKVETCKLETPMTNIDVVSNQQDYSNILGSHGVLGTERKGYEIDSSVRENVIEPISNVITDLDKEEDNLVQAEVGELFDQEKMEYVASEQDNIANQDQDDNKNPSNLDKKESLMSNDFFRNQDPSDLMSSNCPDENLEANCQERESLSNTSHFSDPRNDEPDCNDCPDEFEKSKPHEVEPCVKPFDQSYKCAVQDNFCVSPCEHPSDASDQNKQHVTNNSEPCSMSNDFNTNINTSAEKGQTSAENVNVACPDLRFSVDVSFDLPSNSSMDTCLEKESAVPPEDKTSACDSLSQNALGIMNLCVENDWPRVAQSGNTTSPSAHHNGLDQHSEALIPDAHAENSKESFEELETSEEERLMPDVLYGKPLSDEDSETDEANQNKDTSLAKSVIYSQKEEPKKITSEKITKLLQPLVVLKMLKPVTATKKSFHCKMCTYTTHNLDNLIEHNHSSHIVYNLQYCKNCNLYLIGTERTEKHLCNSVKPSSKSPSKTIMKRRRHQDYRRCKKCGIVFRKRYQYIAHMRIHTGKTPYRCNGCGFYFSQGGSLRRHKLVPGRCKKDNNLGSTSEADIDENKLPTKDLRQKKSPVKLHECHVKLTDVAKTNFCSFCGKSFLTAEMAKNHISSVHKQRNLSLGLPSTKAGGDAKSEKLTKRGKCKCPFCPRLFRYTYNRAQHLRVCVRDLISAGKCKVSGKYQCPLCHSKFISSSNRNRHVRITCLRNYIFQLAKDRREETEATEKNIKNKETEKNSDLKEIQSKEYEQPTQPKVKQIKTKEPSSKPNKPTPSFKCKFCPALFSQASGMYRHMKKKHYPYKHTGNLTTFGNSILSSTVKTAISDNAKVEKSDPNLDSRSAPLSCHFCDKCFTTLQSLKKHEQSHKGEKPYRCLECGRTFKRRCYMTSHKIVHQKKIHCTICKKIFPTIRELIQHRTSHLNSGKLQCPECNLQFQYSMHLKRHLDGHKKREKEFTNLNEEPQTKSRETLESVKEDQCGQVKLQCSLCEDAFNNAHDLRKHCLTHASGSSSTQCPFCKKNCLNRRCLLRHMNRHTGNKAFSCSKCGKQFYREVFLKLHHDHCLHTKDKNLDTMETNPKTQVANQCCYCPRLFTKKMRLKAHILAHKSNSLVQCLQCMLYFGHNKLNQHKAYCEGTQLQTGELSSLGISHPDTSQISQNVKIDSKYSVKKDHLLKCPHCTQRFRFKSLLLRHLFSHTGVHPYTCVHCGKGFRSRSTCLQHSALCQEDSNKKQLEAQSDVVTHSLKRPFEGKETEFKCKFCTKSFIKARHLRRHILTHNEVNPYRCKTCDSCFSRYDHLKIHQIHCTGKRPRLEVCIPKISLDDVGRGWQIKYGSKTSEYKNTFDCEACSRSFSSSSNLSRHNTMFHLAKLFKCTRCGSSFANEKYLRKHQTMKRCDKYVCNYCPLAFHNNTQLSLHTRLHTGEKPYSCNYCGQGFIRKDYLKRHFPKCPKKTLNSVKTTLCDRCGGLLPEDELDDHRKICTSKPSPPDSTVLQSQTPVTGSPPKGFSCAFCSSRFLLFSQLQEHFLNSHSLETAATPTSTVPLQHHLSTISKFKEEPLDESCDKIFSDVNFIHKADNHLDRRNPSPFSCPECKMSFISKAGLKGHLRVHSKVTPFSCKTCKKGFWNKNFLKNHYKKCRFGLVPVKNISHQMEVPVKAEIDFALEDSVLLFREGSKSTGTGVLQTSFSCKEEVTDESQQNSDTTDAHSIPSNEKKTVQYQCSECDKSFTDGLLLITHLEAHGREEQDKKHRTCAQCHRVCKSKGHLEKHMQKHRTDNKISCPNCPMSFYTSADLEIHKKCHELSKPFSCKLCNRSFWTRPLLCQHYGEEHPDDVYTCFYCKKTYSSKKSLWRHCKKWHQNEKKEKRSSENHPGSVFSATRESEEGNNSADSDSDCAPYFPCHVCGKTFPTSESLEDHQLCHLGEKPHECAECGKCFFQASQLQQHQRMHKSEFQCQLCSRGFVSLFALRKHKHSHGKSRPYRCSKCYLSFTGPLQLAEHMSSHQDENFPCDICNRVFSSKTSRAEHRKSHSKSRATHTALNFQKEHKELSSVHKMCSGIPGELKYRCGVCSERFSDPEKLSEHGCLAAQERPYSCLDCNQHFLDPSHLKKHRNTHQTTHPSQKYSCNLCNKSFSTSQDFLTHLKGHISANAGSKTEVKDECPSQSFVCPVCTKCFVSATELMCHFPVHLQNVFECQMCKMPFPSGDKLEQHECCHRTPGSPIKCSDCHQNFLGSVAFHQHKCLHQQGTTMKAETLNLSMEVSAPSCSATVEEEDVDVTGEDLHQCSACSKQFSSKSGLLEHQNKEHLKEKPHSCGEKLTQGQCLQEQKQKHIKKSLACSTTKSSEKKLKCSQCHSEFNTVKELSLHMRMHAEKDVGEHRCDMCYKSFRQLSLLKQHRESHMGQVVYECNECDKAFAFPHLLEEHQQTHASSP